MFDIFRNKFSWKLWEQSYFRRSPSVVRYLFFYSYLSWTLICIHSLYTLKGTITILLVSGPRSEPPRRQDLCPGPPAGSEFFFYFSSFCQWVFMYCYAKNLSIFLSSSLLSSSLLFSKELRQGPGLESNVGQINMLQPLWTMFFILKVLFKA